MSYHVVCVVVMMYVIDLLWFTYFVNAKALTLFMIFIYHLNIIIDMCGLHMNFMHIYWLLSAHMTCVLENFVDQLASCRVQGLLLVVEDVIT